MLRKDFKGNKYVLDLLDEAGLTIENCKSKKLKQYRDVLIYTYVYEMSREEVCANMDFISLSTYNRILKKALKIIEKKI